MYHSYLLYIVIMAMTPGPIPSCWDHTLYLLNYDTYYLTSNRFPILIEEEEIVLVNILFYYL
jgi:hypothetical protein